MSSNSPAVVGVEEIVAAYRTLLGRDPDEAGLQLHLEAKHSHEALAQAIMLSPEFQARQPASIEEITAAYRMLLGRDPDEAGLQAKLAAKFSSQSLVRSILLSPEFRARQMELKNVIVYGLEFAVPVNELMYHGDYEPSVFHELMKRLHPGMTFLDVGANIGLFAIHAAKRGAHVIAIEARRSNVALLLENMRKHHVSIELHPLAVSDRAAYAVLDLSENVNAGIRRHEATSIGDEVVATQRIDAIIEDRNVDVVKIDVEGHEYRAMLGANRLLSRCRPVVITEYSPEFQGAGSGVEGMTYINLFLKYGYRVSVLRDSGPQRIEPDDIDSEWAKAPTHIDLLLEPIP